MAARTLETAANAAVTAVRRVVIVGSSAERIASLRGGLIAAIAAGRHSVRCFAPEISDAGVSRLQAIGADTKRIELRPQGFSLFPTRRVISGLAADLKEYHPHAVLAFGPETPLVIRAARKAGVPRIVALVSDWPEGLLTEAVVKSVKGANVVVVHNRDHERALGRKGLLPPDVTLVRVPGAGVDLILHQAQPLPPFDGGLKFLMIARLAAEKGVLDFCEAARQVKAKHPAAMFTLAGPSGDGPGALTHAKLQPYADVVEILDAVPDVRPLLARCHVYVSPSHREGMPLTVLEALAAGRAIITSDAPGCRETVDERVNGCLVPPGHPERLAAAIESFFADPGLVVSAGRASRSKAERNFSQRVVNSALLKVLGL